MELMDAREEHLESLQKAARTPVNKYMAKFPKQDLFFYYITFQLYALKDVLNTSRFTILGDLSQGIYAYRGTSDWQDVIHDVFEEDCN